MKYKDHNAPFVKLEEVSNITSLPFMVGENHKWHLVYLHENTYPTDLWVSSWELHDLYTRLSGDNMIFDKFLNHCKAGEIDFTKF